MTILFAAIAASGLLYALWPMLSDHLPSSAHFAGARNEKDILLTQIEDLDLEFAAGKIPDDAYRNIRDELVHDAAESIKANKSSSHV